MRTVRNSSHLRGVCTHPPPGPGTPPPGPDTPQPGKPPPCEQNDWQTGVKNITFATSLRTVINGYNRIGRNVSNETPTPNSSQKINVNQFNIRQVKSYLA